MSQQARITNLLAHKNDSAKWGHDAAEVLAALDGNLDTVSDPTIAYAGSPFTFEVGTPITPAAATLGGGPTTEVKAIDPLPAGLILNPETGEITGTPQAEVATANFTIVAVGVAGDGQVEASITVDPAP